MQWGLTPCALLIAAAAAATDADAGKTPDLKQRFEQLDDRGDHAGIVSLWRANPRQTLEIIDSYLEGSLKLWEDAATPDGRTIAAMHRRALRGAQAADEAFERSIFSDYASAFVGWNDGEKKRFRQGQEAFARSSKALEEKQYSVALQAGRECLDLAQPLGDWWGMAMAHSSNGAAEEGLGHPEAALAAHSTARMIYYDLVLAQAEYRNLLAMAALLEKVQRYPRALVTIDKALELARILGDEKGPAELHNLRNRVEQAMHSPAKAGESPTGAP